MNEQNPPNVFRSSIYMFVLFILVQIAVNLPFALSGSPLSPLVGVFTWFAVSAALAWGMLSKHVVTRTNIMMIQASACFYLTAVGIGLGLRGGTTFDASFLARIIGVGLVLFASGVAGFYFSQYVRARRSAAA